MDTQCLQGKKKKIVTNYAVAGFRTQKHNLGQEFTLTLNQSIQNGTKTAKSK